MVLKKKFSLEKKNDIFLIFAQNIDCGYSLEPPCRGGSNEYPQSMFWSKNPQFYYIQVGYEGVYITRTCFPDGWARCKRKVHNRLVTNIINQSEILFLISIILFLILISMLILLSLEIVKIQNLFINQPDI